MSANPFATIHADAWTSELVDVPSINKGVSDFLMQRIVAVRGASAGAKAAQNSASVLLLGTAGSGKTHLFARLRKQTGPRAVFVHTRPEIGADPSPRQVLAAILRSLRRTAVQSDAQEERQQIDVIGGAMLADLGGAKAHFPLAFLDDCRAQPSEAQKALIERAVTQVEARCPEIWPRYLERLLSVLFAGLAEQRALFSWLAGEEPSQLELDRIGERGGLKDLDVLPALRTLGAVASFGAPIVLVFDQLENLAEDDGRTGRILAHARVVSELRDTVRGLVLVQMALESAWASRFHPVLHMSDRDRLEETVKHLTLPTSEEKRQLIELWRAALPEAERSLPFPYPFTIAESDKWTKQQGVTPRMLMQACGEAYARVSMPEGDDSENTEPAPVAPVEPLRGQWEERIVEARARIDEDAQQERGVSPDTIRGGLIAALELLGVKAGAAVKKDIPSLKLHKGATERSVLIAQHAHHRSLASVVRAATGLAAEHAVVLLRERAFAIRPTWKEVDRLLDTFLETPGAQFVQIDREDLERLIALENLLSAARSQDLCAEDGQPIPYAEVVRWAERELGCSRWAPIMAALGHEIDHEIGASPSKPVSNREPVIARVRVGLVREVLGRLRVASIDRLVREVRAVDPGATRAMVMAELGEMRIEKFGDAVVALEESWV